MQWWVRHCSRNQFYLCSPLCSPFWKLPFYHPHSYSQSSHINTTCLCPGHSWRVEEWALPGRIRLSWELYLKLGDSKPNCLIREWRWCQLERLTAVTASTSVDSSSMVTAKNEAEAQREAGIWEKKGDLLVAYNASVLHLVHSRGWAASLPCIVGAIPRFLKQNKTLFADLVQKGFLYL